MFNGCSIINETFYSCQPLKKIRFLITIIIGLEYLLRSFVFNKMRQIKNSMKINFPLERGLGIKRLRPMYLILIIYIIH